MSLLTLSLLQSARMFVCLPQAGVALKWLQVQSHAIFARLRTRLLAKNDKD